MPTPPVYDLPAAERRPVHNFADILANIGWYQPTRLAKQVNAWRNLLLDTQPNLILMDHSPTALLVSQGCRVKRMLLGSGFVIPPDVSPLPSLNPMASSQRGDRTSEPEVLNAANACLASMNQPPLSRLGALYTRADAVILTTLSELDHYGPRQGAAYLGAWPGNPQSEPIWPKGRGPKVFAYLKPFPELRSLLHMLRRSGLPTLAYITDIDSTRAHRMSQHNLRVINKPVDLKLAAQKCDLAVLHAGLGSVTTMMLTGVPMLLIPLQQEQLQLAARVAQLGAAQIASVDSVKQISQGLQRLLTNDCLTHAAKAFALRYKSYDPDANIQTVIERIESLLSM